MIAALSIATSGLQRALSSFDMAATALVANTYQNDQSIATELRGSGSLDSVMTGIVSARLAVRASLVAAHTANEMVGDLVTLEYPHPVRW